MSADAFSRLQRRLGRPQRSARRSALLVGVAVVLAAALVVGIVAVWRDPSSRRVPSAPAPVGTPRRIAAVTSDFHLVVLDSRTGRTYSSTSRAGASGRSAACPSSPRHPMGRRSTSPASIRPALPAVRRRVRRRSSACRSTASRTDVVARGRNVAVSTTGQLATARDHDLCASGPGALDLGAPTSRRLPASPFGGGEVALSDLRWTPDGRTLTFNRAGARRKSSRCTSAAPGRTRCAQAAKARRRGDLHLRPVRRRVSRLLRIVAVRLPRDHPGPPGEPGRRETTSMLWSCTRTARSHAPCSVGGRRSRRCTATHAATSSSPRRRSGCGSVPQTCSTAGARATVRRRSSATA